MSRGCRSRRCHSGRPRNVAIPIALAGALAIIAVTVAAFHLDLAVVAAVARTLAHALINTGGVITADGAVFSAVDLAVLAAVPATLTLAFDAIVA